MHSGIHPDMGEIFFALCKTVDSPTSLGAWLRYKYSHSELASMDVNPRSYTCATAFHLDYSVVSLLSKYKGLKTGIDVTAVALQKFKSSEEVCRETNLRFKNLASVRNGRLHSVLHAAQRKIARLLGPFSLFALDRRYGWGPGATVEIPRRRASVDTKICELPITVTRSARSMLHAEMVRDLHWSASILGTIPEGDFCYLPSTFLLTEESRIETVPKNAKTERVIAVEPRGNSFLQKGFGDYFRTKLRSVGVDLDDQGRNQELARRAYSEGFATLDLRAASDTVSKEVVYNLLPYDWAASMDAVRTRRAVMPDGSKVVLEKFSSMGNGFTFELESLIFWALCSAVNDLNGGWGEVAVYGDDIIVQREIATEVCLTLQFCGFSINDDKSFLDGPFYESCGEHYFQGFEVTPAYQKEPLSSLSEVMRCANRLMRLAFRIGRGQHLDKRVLPAWQAARRFGGAAQQCAIPFGTEGDDGFLVLSSETVHIPPPRKWEHDLRRPWGEDGLRCRVLREPTRRFPGIDRALLAWTLRDRHKSERILTLWDDPPVPYLGIVEFAPRVAKPSVAYRWVIPSVEFSLDWH